MIYTIIPFKDNFFYTKNICEQLKNYQNIIIDNGTTCEKTKNYIQDNFLGTVLEGKGLNIHEMWNRGIEKALQNQNCKIIAILNNDIQLSEKALETCTDALQKNENLALVFPGNNLPESQINLVELWHQYGKLLGAWNMLGYCMILKTDWLLKTKYRFPEKMVYWCGDNDLLLSVITSGHQSGFVGGCWVEHLNGGGNTGNWEIQEKKEIIKNDKKLLIEKWPDVGGFGNL